MWVGPGKDRSGIREESRQIREKPEQAPKRPEPKVRNGNDEEMRKHRKKGSKTAAEKTEQTEQNKPKRPERSGRSNNLRKKFVSCRKQRRPNMELSDKKFAVLIDADNISHRKIKDILDEIANYGTPTIKRIYGDFTDPKFAAWKSILLENSITPIQQYAYTTGKNATDSALIIDAMDILHKESVNGFCIVSSDSDYTRLASRIRESGREVLGFGEKKTPKPFIKSCDKFIYVEILGQPAAPTPALAPAPGTAPAATQAPAAKAAQKKTSAKRRQTSDTQAPGTPGSRRRQKNRSGSGTDSGCGSRFGAASGYGSGSDSGPCAVPIDHPSDRRRF